MLTKITRVDSFLEGIASAFAGLRKVLLCRKRRMFDPRGGERNSDNSISA